MARWWSTPRLRMTQQEYRANISGMNIFFGAVLGVVMAGSEALAPLNFAALLFVTASIVITILYVSSSPHRLTYAVFAGVFTAFLPRVFEEVLPGTPAPPNLQPTLAVWLTMTLIVEFAPRDRDAPPEPPPVGD